MNNKLLISALLVAGLAGTSGAQASAVATAYLDIYNAKLTDSSGNKLTLGSNIIFVGPGNVNNNGDTAANLNGTVVTNALDQPANPGGLDIPASVVGTAYAENSFTYITAPSVATTNYAHGDALLTGAIVNIGGPTPDVQAQTLAEISLAGNGIFGTAAGNNIGVQGTVAFQALTTNTINIYFLADAYVRAMVASDQTGSADASVNWSIALLNLGTGANLSFAPSELNGDASRSATNPGQDFEYSLTGAAFSHAFNIVQGQSYQLTINQVANTNAKTNPVPEPVSLLLMSLGLFGFAWTKRLKN
jgi:hypothetical protein